MAATPTSSAAAAAPVAIASASSLPPRVRRLLELFFTQVAKDLGERVNQMLVDFEQQLFRQADRARSNELQSEHFANLHALRHNRSDLLPRFLEVLEAEFACIREPRKPAPKPSMDQVEYRTLTLVADADMDQDIVLREIAGRHETRSHAALYLMGQRFGVLAGSPAFDAAQLPVGPQALCRALRASAPLVRVDLSAQLLLYKAFDHKVLAEYARWIEVLNELLSQQGVLPGLVFAPPRARGDKNAPSQRRHGPHAQGSTGAAPRGDGARPMTGWHGQAEGQWSAFGGGAGGPASASAGAPAAAAPLPTAEAASFASLQQLLSGRRAGSPPGVGGAFPGGASGTGHKAPGVPLSTHDVLANLRALQAQPIPFKTGQPHRTMDDVQETLLAQVRKEHGAQAELVQEDADTFELLGMLYSEIEREVQSDAPAVDLLVQLQVPVAQAALHDRKFFLRAQHPARELLNSVAESGATWLAEDEMDPVLLQKLQQAVDRVVAEYAGDEQVFENANAEVQGHYKAMARKAEVTERRHVEAARGKDRLEVAKRRAEEVIEGAFGERKPARFVQALLSQAWADVLTLTLLRNGEESEDWRDYLDVTRRIAATTAADDDHPAPADAELAGQIEKALSQVGYHGDEAAAIARRLSSADAEDETTSRTELTARLKARTKLGEPVVPKKPPQPERSAREQECHEYLRTLPFGTWFEFVRNQQGDASRQRLSWFSPVTDNALFVNQRGQRVGEHSLDSLARLMARDQVRVVTEDKGRLIDRAWQATVKALRSFTGGSAPLAEGAGA
jgi:hypothetical protein